MPGASALNSTMMTHRVISLGTYPLRLLDHIRVAGCLVRLEETAVRAPVALVGDGRVWAVGELRDVKPTTRGKEAPQGFLWCIDHLREVEDVACAHYDLIEMFHNGENLEPRFLQADAQAELNRILAPPETAQEIPQAAPDKPELTPLEQLNSAIKAAVLHTTGAEERWEARRASGLDSEQLETLIRAEIGFYCGATWPVSWSANGAGKLRLWLDVAPLKGDTPTIEGAQFVRAVRGLFRIPFPPVVLSSSTPPEASEIAVEVNERGQLGMVF